MQYVGQAPLAVAEILDICVDRYLLEAGEVFDEHHHPYHQLTWSPCGVLAVTVGRAHWSLAPSSALWIPAGVPHTVGALQAADVHTLYVRVETCPLAWDVTLVPMSALLQAVSGELGRPELPRAKRARLEAVLFDHLQPYDDGSSLPLPADPRAADVARALRAHPADGRTLQEWGRHVGASERTLSRHFTSETGFTFTEWRCQLRVRAALAHLATGAPVGQVAVAVGYRDTSAFIDAFQRVTGHTPTSHPAIARRRVG